MQARVLTFGRALARHTFATGQAVNRAEEATEAATSKFKAFLASKLGLVASGGLVALFALNAAATTGSDWFYRSSILRTLDAGVVPKIRQRVALPRQLLRRQLMDLLKIPTEYYHVIAGPPGSGKSCMLRESVADAGGGVGYIEVSPCWETDWGDDFGAAFGFRFEEHLTLFNVVSQALLGGEVRKKESEHPLASLRRAAEALQSAAVQFKKLHGRPFVLVVDSADRMNQSQNGQKALAAMLDYCRDWASEGLITVVWVAHSWRTIETLEGSHTTRSRASPPLLIGDISDEEGVEYLSLLGVEGKHAHDCLSLVGGSLLLLERCASMRKAGVDMDVLKCRLLDLMEMAYLQAGLLDATPLQDQGLSVVEALLRSPQQAISAAEWREHVPDHEHQLLLLDSGIFTFNGHALCFASRLAGVYAAERLRTRVSHWEQRKHKALTSPARRWW